MQSTKKISQVTMKIIAASFHLLLATLFANECHANSIRSSTHRQLATFPLIAGFEPSSDVTDLVRLPSFYFLHRYSYSIRCQAV